MVMMDYIKRKIEEQMGSIKEELKYSHYLHDYSKGHYEGELNAYETVIGLINSMIKETEELEEKYK